MGGIKKFVFGSESKQRYLKKLGEQITKDSGQRFTKSQKQTLKNRLQIILNIWERRLFAVLDNVKDNLLKRNCNDFLITLMDAFTDCENELQKDFQCKHQKVGRDIPDEDFDTEEERGAILEQALCESHEDLVNVMNMKTIDICDHIAQKNILSESDEDWIKNGPVREEQNRKLLQVIATTPSSKIESTVIPTLKRCHPEQAESLEKNIKRIEKNPPKPKCVTCRIRDGINLSRIAKKMFTVGAITPAIYQDLTNDSVPNKQKWDCIMKKDALQAAVIKALSGKFTEYYKQCTRRNITDLRCRCKRNTEADSQQLLDVAATCDESSSTSGDETDAEELHTSLTEERKPPERPKRKLIYRNRSADSIGEIRFQENGENTLRRVSSKSMSDIRNGPLSDVLKDVQEGRAKTSRDTRGCNRQLRFTSGADRSHSVDYNSETRDIVDYVEEPDRDSGHYSSLDASCSFELESNCEDETIEPTTGPSTIKMSKKRKPGTFQTFKNGFAKRVPKLTSQIVSHMQLQHDDDSNPNEESSTIRCEKKTVQDNGSCILTASSRELVPDDGKQIQCQRDDRKLNAEKNFTKTKLSKKKGTLQKMKKGFSKTLAKLKSQAGSHALVQQDIDTEPSEVHLYYQKRDSGFFSSTKSLSSRDYFSSSSEVDKLLQSEV